MLAARAHLRLGDPTEALAATAALHFSDRARAEIALLRAASFTRTGDDDRAAAAFADARAHAISAADSALAAETEFYVALAAFGEGDMDGARDAALYGLDLSQQPSRSGGIMPRLHVIARLQELLMILDAGSGRYVDVIEYARDSLATLDRSGVQDVYLEAFALRNLASLCRDFDLSDSRKICERAKALPWTADIAHVQFTTLEATGWSYALRGDVFEALSRFRVADGAATTTPERVFVAVDRALMARESGYVEMAREEIAHALEIAETFDWADAAGDYRNALLNLAQVAAPVAPARARAMLDRYSAIGKRMDPLFASRIESRARAEESYTHGLVLRAEGRLDASAERLHSAFATWAGIGYAWRAARAALELAELDRGDVFRLAVRRELQLRPNSVFSARARLVA